MAYLSVHTPSPPLSPIKRNRGDCPSIPVEKGSSKRAHVLEDGDSENIIPFFRRTTILPTWLPNTLEEFTTTVASKDLAFVQNLTAADRQGLFADASRTLFRAYNM